METLKKEYSQKDFKRILELRDEKRILEALEKYRKYIKEYPNDTTVLLSFAGFLVELNCLEESEIVLNRVVITEKTFEENIKQFHYVKLKLLGAQGKFEECYKLFQEKRSLFEEMREDYYFIQTYLRKKVENATIEALPMYSYTVKQVIEYSEERALEHINKHEYHNNYSKSKFVENFPIEQCYKNIRNMIATNKENKYFTGIFKNFYTFKYYNCGIENGVIVDYIRVITLQDTNEIITMYPMSNDKLYRYIDITPKQKEEELGKKLTKKMSQIDKFNKRYGL